jgi:hypothetical protein
MGLAGALSAFITGQTTNDVMASKTANPTTEEGS